MRKLAVALGLTIVALPASAQQFMEPAGGSWSVVGLGDSCIAINRSPAEFNVAPFNGLALHQFKTDDLPRLQAFYWPGAFTPGEAVTLKVVPQDREPVELAGEAVSDFQVVSKDAAPEHLLEAMSNVPSVQVSTEAVGQILLFETGPLEAVADLMGKCINAPATP